MKKLWFLSGIFFLCLDLAYASNEGTAGVPFLKLPSSAKAAGMGGAYVALAKDAHSLFINPAGLAYIRQHSLATTYVGWVEGIKTGLISYSFPSETAKGVISGGLLYMSSGAIEGMTFNDVATGNIYAQSGVAALSYGRLISERLSLGGNLKFIWEELGKEDVGLAPALDLGLLFEPKERLSFGLAVKNIGSKIKIDKEGDKLPLSVQAGCAYRFKNALTLALDLEASNDSPLRGHTGLEYWYKDRIAFRAGYNQTEAALGELSGLTLGASFKAASKTRTKDSIFSILGCLSYAYFSLGDFEGSHIVSYQADF